MHQVGNSTSRQRHPTIQCQYYTFAGQTVAQREKNLTTGADTLTYLHSDHLGSVSVSTNSTGTLLGSQEFGPWGQTRTALGGGAQVTETKLNYTGQKKDSTGLLYYHARMYDPALGRFVSPDSIVPGASSGVGGAGGTVGQEENSKLTVDFHESVFLSSVAGENGTTLQKGFWFQLRGEDKQKVGEPWGPNNPQALSRYAYVLNNPLRYVDPLGHWLLTVDYGTRSGWMPHGVSLTLSRNELRQFIDGLKAGESVFDLLADIIIGASWLTGLIPGAVATIAKFLDNLNRDVLIETLEKVYDAEGTVSFYVGLMNLLRIGKLSDVGMVYYFGPTVNGIEDGPHYGERHNCNAFDCPLPE